MALAGASEALSLCETCVKLYQNLQGPTKQLSDTYQRTEHIRINLKALEDLLSNSSPIANLQPSLSTHLQSLITQIRTEMRQVERIFRKWNAQHKDIFDRLGNILGSDGEKLTEINKKLDFLATAVHETTSNINTVAINQLMRNSNPTGGQSLGQSMGQQGRLTSHAPSTANHGRKGVMVVFVDDYNETWSILASAYMRLLKSWVLQKPGAYWPVETCHSGGLFVRSNSQMARVPPQIEHRSIAGGTPPNKTGVATLFDSNLIENPPDRLAIRHETSTRPSRGLYDGIFDSADYIFAFEDRHVQILRQAQQAWGRQSAKAKIGIIGEYCRSPETGGAQIYELSESDLSDGARAQSLWTRRVARIKTGLKVWLGSEFGWQH